VDPRGDARRRHSRGGVHGVAPKVEHDSTAADDAADDGATGQADPDLEVEVVRIPPAVYLSQDRPPEPKRRFGVVGACLRCTRHAMCASPTVLMFSTPCSAASTSNRRWWLRSWRRPTPRTVGS
jgi:hypothetical protein